jgi:hypothetical protein
MMQTQTRGKKSSGNTMTPAQARALLQAEQQAVIQACSREINRVLEKHNCVLGAVPTVVPSSAGGGFVLGANVVVQPKAEG